MKKICVVTATRAEYGVLRRIIQNIIADSGLELALVVSGSHLSKRHGYTVDEIEQDGFPIAERIGILERHDTEADICQAMGNAAVRFGEMYGRQKPDMVIVVGDRYELLPICSSAMIYGIPIAHISGGEITEGAMDDVVRHCITKMSYLHFPACEEYRRRIIQLGEEPERVFNFGDVGVENVRKMDYLPKAQLERFMGISLDRPYASVTFHPVTLERDSARKQTEELVSALGKYKQLNFIVTMANSDLQGEEINKIFHEGAEKYENIVCYTSLGVKMYLSLIKYAEFVIGNSSSGIIEVPCFGIPTINIGDRQKGRLRAKSVIDCEPKSGDIERSIEKALSPSFRKIAQEAENPYGEGDTACSIVKTIKSFLEEGVVSQKKKFYDVEGGM